MERERASAVVWAGRDDVRTMFTTPVVEICVVVGLGGILGCDVLLVVVGYGFDFATAEFEEVLARICDIAESLC